MRLFLPNIELKEIQNFVLVASYIARTPAFRLAKGIRGYDNPGPSMVEASGSMHLDRNVSIDFRSPRELPCP